MSLLIKKLRPLSYLLLLSSLPLTAAWDGQPPEYTPAEEEKESAYAIENYTPLSQEEKNQRLFDAAAGGYNRQALTKIDAQSLYWDTLPPMTAQSDYQHILKKNAHFTPVNAIYNHYCDNIEKLLACGANVNAQDTYGMTPLHYAAGYGHSGATELLLARGAKINAQNKQRCTPLHYASFNGHTTTVKQLCSRQANVKAKNVRLFEPIHYAAYSDRSAIITLLLTHKAHVDAKDENEKQAIHIAAMKGHTNTIQLLIRHGVKPSIQNTFQHTPLHFAAKKGHTTAVQCLLDHGALINAREQSGWEPIHNAACNRHFNTVQLLLDYKANPNAKTDLNGTPLYLAIPNKINCLIEKKNVTKTIKILLTHKADINQTGYRADEEPTCLAARLGDTTILQLLLDHKAPLEHDNRLVCIAAQRGHTQAIDLLISHGAFFDAQTINNTPLEYALKSGHPETAAQLLHYEFTHLKPHNEYEKIACIASIAWQLPCEVVEIIANYKGLEEDKKSSANALGFIFHSIYKQILFDEPGTIDFLPPHLKLDIYNKSVNKLTRLYPRNSLPFIMKLRETPFDQQPLIKTLVKKAFDSLRIKKESTQDPLPAAAESKANQHPRNETEKLAENSLLIATILAIS